MRSFYRYLTRLSSAAMLSLAACSGESLSAGPQVDSYALEPTTNAALSVRSLEYTDMGSRSADDQIVVADYGTSMVTVFGGGGQVDRQIPARYTSGVATDASGTLYIVRQGQRSEIGVYPKPYGQPSLTLHKATTINKVVAVAPDGTVASGDEVDPSIVTFWKKGTVVPCLLLHTPKFQVTALAFDESGALIAGGLAGTIGNIRVGFGRIAGECKATGFERLTTRNTVLNQPTGMQVLANGNVAILLGGQPGTALYTYAAPTGGSLGSPLWKTLFGTKNINSAGFAIKEYDHTVWVINNDTESVSKYPYPAGGSPIKTLDYKFQAPLGIAVNPARS